MASSNRVQKYKHLEKTRDLKKLESLLQIQKEELEANSHQHVVPQPTASAMGVEPLTREASVDLHRQREQLRFDILRNKHAPSLRIPDFARVPILGKPEQKEARKGNLTGQIAGGQIYSAKEIKLNIDNETASISLGNFILNTRKLGQGDSQSSLENLYFISIDASELPVYHFWLAPNDRDISEKVLWMTSGQRNQQILDRALGPLDFGLIDEGRAEVKEEKGEVPPTSTLPSKPSNSWMPGGTHYSEINPKRAFQRPLTQWGPSSVVNYTGETVATVARMANPLAECPEARKLSQDLPGDHTWELLEKEFEQRLTTEKLEDILSSLNGTVSRNAMKKFLAPGSPSVSPIDGQGDIADKLNTILRASVPSLPFKLAQLVLGCYPSPLKGNESLRRDGLPDGWLASPADNQQESQYEIFRHDEPPLSFLEDYQYKTHVHEAEKVPQPIASAAMKNAPRVFTSNLGCLGEEGERKIANPLYDTVVSGEQLRSSNMAQTAASAPELALRGGGDADGLDTITPKKIWTRNGWFLLYERSHTVFAKLVRQLLDLGGNDPFYVDIKSVSRPAPTPYPVDPDSLADIFRANLTGPLFISEGSSFWVRKQGETHTGPYDIKYETGFVNDIETIATSAGDLFKRTEPESEESLTDANNRIRNALKRLDPKATRFQLHVGDGKLPNMVEVRLSKKKSGNHLLVDRDTLGRIRGSFGKARNKFPTMKVTVRQKRKKIIEAPIISIKAKEVDAEKIREEQRAKLGSNRISPLPNALLRPTNDQLFDIKRKPLIIVRNIRRSERSAKIIMPVEPRSEKNQQEYKQFSDEFTKLIRKVAGRGSNHGPMLEARSSTWRNKVVFGFPPNDAVLDKIQANKLGYIPGLDKHDESEQWVLDIGYELLRDETSLEAPTTVPITGVKPVTAVKPAPAIKPVPKINFANLGEPGLFPVPSSQVQPIPAEQHAPMRPTATVPPKTPAVARKLDEKEVEEALYKLCTDKQVLKVIDLAREYPNAATEATRRWIKRLEGYKRSLEGAEVRDNINAPAPERLASYFGPMEGNIRILQAALGKTNRKRKIASPLVDEQPKSKQPRLKEPDIPLEGRPLPPIGHISNFPVQSGLYFQNSIAEARRQQDAHDDRSRRTEEEIKRQFKDLEERNRTRVAKPSVYRSMMSKQPFLGPTRERRFGSDSPSFPSIYFSVPTMSEFHELVTHSQRLESEILGRENFCRVCGNGLTHMSAEDIHFHYRNHLIDNMQLICPECLEPLSEMKPAERTRHLEHHIQWKNRSAYEEGFANGKKQFELEQDALYKYSDYSQAPDSQFDGSSGHSEPSSHQDHSQPAPRQPSPPKVSNAAKSIVQATQPLKPTPPSKAKAREDTRKIFLGKKQAAAIETSPEKVELLPGLASILQKSPGGTLRLIGSDSGNIASSNFNAATETKKTVRFPDLPPEPSGQMDKNLHTSTSSGTKEGQEEQSRSNKHKSAVEPMDVIAEVDDVDMDDSSFSSSSSEEPDHESDGDFMESDNEDL